MHLKAEILDDLLMEVYEYLLSDGRRLKGRRGAYRELSGVLLEVNNPLSRISNTETKGTVFSCLGELLWYLSGSNNYDYIAHYIPYEQYVCVGLDRTIEGAYGPRLLNMHNRVDQISYVVELLKENPSSRQAVIQLYDASDIYIHQKNIPCTLTLQFLLRDNKLDMFTSMRSNDVLLGLPNDFFCFSMIQELIACKLKCELGTYKHFVASLHIYESDISKALRFIDEGYGPTEPIMDPMPQEDLEASLKAVIRTEECIRTGTARGALEVTNLAPYWLDLLKLLQIYSLSKKTPFEIDSLNQIRSIKNSLATKSYSFFVNRKINKLENKLELQ
jgi:thymidylate synthase